MRRSSKNRLGWQVIAFLCLAISSNLFSWGPHDKITEAALNVIPDAERIKNIIGKDNFYALQSYSWMPDQLCQDLKKFYVDEYLLNRQLPHYIEHRMPDVRQGIAPHFKRALQALRTESPREACRQLGPLLHYVEDMGAPPHAMAVYTPEHGPMENWVRIEMINISGYQPVLLGRTDEEALAGLLKRLDKLVAFSVERAEKILPMVKKGEGERGNVEPIVLECALETARVVADMLYTVFTLGLSEQPEGAELEGTISFADFPFHREKGAYIILLDNLKYSKLYGQVSENRVVYTSATDYTTHTDREGRYEFRNLPEGEYRILATRVGSRTVISQPIKLEKGKVAHMDLSLPTTSPPKNFVQNPDFGLYYIREDMPDMWFKATSWMYPGVHPTSAIIRLPSNTTFRCGAVRKVQDVNISFQFRETLWGVPVATLTLEKGQMKPKEVFYQTKDKEMFAVVIIETEKPLKEVVEQVWVSETTMNIEKVESLKKSEETKSIPSNEKDSRLLISFKFDEGAGNSVKDSSGNYTGNISGNFSWVKGKEGYAISFNGTDTKLMVPGTEMLNPLKVTLSAWIKTTSKTPGTIVEKWKSNAEPGYRLSYVPPSVSMVIYYTGGAKTISGKIPVNDGQWHYVAGVYNGKQMKIYIDGKETCSESLEQDISKGNSASITIGYREWQGGSSFFNGIIDDVEIYEGSPF